MANAEPTAMDKPAFENKSESYEGERQKTHEDHSGIDVLAILHVQVLIVFGCLPLVHRVEVKAGIVGLGGLKGGSGSILETASAQQSAT